VRILSIDSSLGTQVAVVESAGTAEAVDRPGRSAATRPTPTHMPVLGFRDPFSRAITRVKGFHDGEG